MTEPIVLLSKQYTVDVHVDTTHSNGESERDVVKIYTRGGSYRDPAFWFHQFCWETIRKNWDNDKIAPERLFSLGVSTRPLYVAPSTVNPYTDDFTLVEALLTLDSNLHLKSTVATSEKAEDVCAGELTLIDLLKKRQENYQMSSFPESGHSWSHVLLGHSFPSQELDQSDFSRILLRW